jgi:broad specificity phosphatase PhoE
MENLDDAAERGYLGLKWLMERPEEKILLVSHGGILRYMMERHPLIVVKDERSTSDGKPADSRFDNCERRSYRLNWVDGQGNESRDRRSIVLTQVDDHQIPSMQGTC